VLTIASNIVFVCVHVLCYYFVIHSYVIVTPNPLYTVCPKPLMSQARLALWKFLPTENKMCSIDCLDIPKILKDYLNHVS